MQWLAFLTKQRADLGQTPVVGILRQSLSGSFRQKTSTTFVSKPDRGAPRIKRLTARAWRALNLALRSSAGSGLMDPSAVASRTLSFV